MGRRDRAGDTDAFEGTAVDADVVVVAFCYFYSALVSDPRNLTLCEVGNYAD